MFFSIYNRCQKLGYRTLAYYVLPLTDMVSLRNIYLGIYMGFYM